MSTNEQQSKLGTDEEVILKALAEDYTVNPGLYMTREDLKERLTEQDDAELDGILQKSASKDFVRLYRDGKGIIWLVKATYEGLRKTGPLDEFKWYPEWLTKEFVF